MKRILLFAALGLSCAGEANAQFALQNFNSSTMPAGWSMIKVDNNTPNSTSLNAWIVSQMSTNAWMLRTRATADSCMLSASLFTPVATADRWLLTPSFTVNDPNMVLSWDDAEGVSGGNDSLEVWVSPTAGTTVASFTQQLYNAPVSPFLAAVTYVKHGAPLGAFNGQTIRVAFRNHSTNQGTIRLDNVQSEVPANPTDAGITGITFPKLVAATSSTPVKITIKNNGAQSITNFDLNYVVDGGTPVVQNFPGLTIYPFGSATLTFTAPIINPAVGPHSLAVNIVQVNGNPDPVTSNNQLTFAFAVPTQTVQRAGLIEEFSSSTCPPCASFNAVFDPLAFAQNANVASSNFNVIKYQMNWPGAGNDYSYNGHGLSRRTYYGVSGIPDHFTNGLQGGAGNLAEITASKTAPAYMDISGTFTVDPSSTTAGNMTGNVSITPHFTVTGNFKVHIAVIERFYQNSANTTGQLDYRFVMRRMLPSGTGTSVTSWTNGVAQSFPISSTPYTVGGVAQMNYNLWGSPIGSDLVIFVQNDEDHTILQSRSIPAAWPTDVPTIANDTKVLIAPNPASDFTVVALDMTTASRVNIHVTDALGKIVYSTSGEFNAGRNDIGINTSELASGLYNVTIQTEKGSITQRLSVVK